MMFMTEAKSLCVISSVYVCVIYSYYKYVMHKSVCGGGFIFVRVRGWGGGVFQCV